MEQRATSPQLHPWRHLLLIPGLHRPGRQCYANCFNLEALHTGSSSLDGPVVDTHTRTHFPIHHTQNWTSGSVFLQTQEDMHTHAIRKRGMQSYKDSPAHTSGNHTSLSVLDAQERLFKQSVTSSLHFSVDVTRGWMVRMRESLEQLSRLSNFPFYRCGN